MANNEKENLISILMPTYNVEKYIEEAVRSIINQTYRNFELIIVDDCSSDRTFDILKKLKAEDKRIKLYRNETNSKICKTLNKALSYATGSYIGRMDGDDISEPERFEVLKKYLDTHPQIALVGSNLISIDEYGHEFSRKKYICTSKGIEVGNHFITSVSHFWLARRDIYKVLKGYREVPFVEDYDFLLRGELQGYRYANVDRYLYRCRIRTGNTGSSNGLRQRKAVKYIQKLHKKEKRTGVDCFQYEDYCKAIEVEDRENEHYMVASKKLNQAIQMKKYPIRMMVNTIEAMVQNRYVAEYIFSALSLRAISIIDQILVKGYEMLW